MLRIGQCYQWSELPGKGHGYVRFENGHVVCANLKPELNPDAPKIILVGQGLLREKWARMLCEQDRSIAFEVYLKQATNKWKYQGEFVVEDWSEAADKIHQHEAKSKRHDVARVIYLRKL
jgi:hypothetical protein